MAFPTLAVRVMIASPSDVETERSLAYEVINRWNAAHSQATGLVLLPMHWETNATAQYGRPAQVDTNEHLTDVADILVGIFWSRLGTPTAEYPSGTVEEIKRHSSTGKLTLLYFSIAKVPRDADSKQLDAVKTFEAEARPLGSPFQYDGPDKFQEVFAHQLAIEMSRRSFRGESRTANDTHSETTVKRALSKDAKRLLIAGSSDPNGFIFHFGNARSPVIQANRFQFTQDGAVRTAAKWEAALKELEGVKLVVDVKGSRQSFKVTDEGFQVADEELPADAKTLLLAGAASRDLLLMEVEHLQGWFLQADVARFPENDGDARSEARWRSALGSLLKHEWLNQKTGCIYRLSDEGLSLAAAVKPAT